MDVSNLPLSQSGRNPLEVATQAVLEAGKLLVDHFYSQKEVKQKSRGNLVTEVDTLSEELILRLLKSELFYAEKGKGAYLNNAPVRASQVGLLKDSLVAFDLGYSDEQGKKMLDIVNKLWGRVHCMRMMG